jgi:hypothetical protein
MKYARWPLDKPWVRPRLQNFSGILLKKIASGGILYCSRNPERYDDVMSNF